MLTTATCKTSQQHVISAACWVETPFKVKSASGEDYIAATFLCLHPTIELPAGSG